MKHGVLGDPATAFSAGSYNTFAHGTQVYPGFGSGRMSHMGVVQFAGNWPWAKRMLKNGRNVRRRAWEKGWAAVTLVNEQRNTIGVLNTKVIGEGYEKVVDPCDRQATDWVLARTG